MTLTNGEEDSCDPNGNFDEALLVDLGWLPLVSLIIYVIAFAIGKP